MKKQLEKEQRSWQRYYDLLKILEEKIATGDPFALKLQRKAREIVSEFVL